MFTAISIILHIFSDKVLDNEPPKTVKSWANTKTVLPLIRPVPVTTPSPKYFCFSIPKFVQRWVTNLSNSINVPLSRRRSILSLAVSLPAWCCFSILWIPPPSSAWEDSSLSFSIFSFIGYYSLMNLVYDIFNTIKNNMSTIN